MKIFRHTKNHVLYNMSQQVYKYLVMTKNLKNLKKMKIRTESNSHYLLTESCQQTYIVYQERNNICCN